MMIMQLDTFLPHTPCKGCYYYLAGKDAQIGCVEVDVEPKEYSAEDVAAEAVAVLDDFGEDKIYHTIEIMRRKNMTKNKKVKYDTGHLH